MDWSSLIPNLAEMYKLFVEQHQLFLENWWATFSVSIVGSLGAIIFALFVSILSLRIKLFEIVMEPVVAISQSFPLQAITPIILIFLGVGFFTKTFIAFLIAFFPIYGACITAIKTTPENLIGFAKIYRSSFFQEVYFVRLPYALPAIISSAKVGFTLAVLGAVIAEFMQPNTGIGRLILIAQSQYQMQVLYICILLLILQGLTVYISLSRIEKYFITKGGFNNE